MGTRSAFTFTNGPVQVAFSVQCERRHSCQFIVQIERNGDVSRKILYSAERVLWTVVNGSDFERNKSIKRSHRSGSVSRSTWTL
jgi:hypothetical protein